jgi:hypothetical protein
MKRISAHSVVLFAILSFFLLLFLMLCLSVPARALGPKVVDAHMLTCDATTETVSGMYVYWRPAGGAFSDAKRMQTGDISKTPLDILTFITANGSYEIAASYYTTSGNESSLSNIVPFVLALPMAPVNARKQ